MIPYTLHVTIILAVCLGFYKLLLGGQTYYRLNRLVLLACLVLAFVLPLVPVPQQFSLLKAEQANTAPPQILAPVMFTEQHAATAQHAAPKVQATPKPEPEIFNRQAIIQWVVWLYWFGMAAFGINFLLQAVVLVYQSRKNESIKDGRYHIVELETDKAPCSFGSYIFINPEKYDWDTYNRILIHEKIHVKGRHSIDLILTELMLVFQWFNPFAWLYRKTVENNLEFLTDDSVLHQHKVDPAAYQWSLLQVSVPNYAVRLATNYNQSLLKKRIMMMDAKRSDVHTLWKYVMLLPVLALLVCGLNKPVALGKPVLLKVGNLFPKTAGVTPKISKVLQSPPVAEIPEVGKVSQNLPAAEIPQVGQVSQNLPAAKIPESHHQEPKEAVQKIAGITGDQSAADTILLIAPKRSVVQVYYRIIDQLYREGLVTSHSRVSLNLNEREFMVDGVKMSDSVHERYFNQFGKIATRENYGNGYAQPYAYGYVQPHGNGYIQPYAQPYGQYYSRRDTERRAAEMATLKAITADMLKDGLITQTHQLSFVLSTRSFTINGKRQPQDIFEKYKRKYVPAISGPNWTWSHTHTDDASHNDIDSDN